MPVFDHPARVTVETGPAPGRVLAALAAVPALAVASAVVAFAARYAVVLAIAAAVTAVVTAAIVRVLYRHCTVLSWRSGLQRSRAAAPPAAVVAIRPVRVTAPPVRRALPAPAPVVAQRPRTGIRGAGHGA